MGQKCSFCKTPINHFLEDEIFHEIQKGRDDISKFNLKKVQDDEMKRPISPKSKIIQGEQEIMSPRRALHKELSKKLVEREEQKKRESSREVHDINIKNEKSILDKLNEKGEYEKSGKIGCIANPNPIVFVPTHLTVEEIRKKRKKQQHN